MRSNEILGGRYQILEEIGSGGTGVIYKAYHLTLQKYVVIKKIKENFVGVMQNRGEADILKRLRHTCLPQVFDFIQVGATVYTVMDYIEGQNLEELIKQGYRFNEATLRKWLRQMCEVLEYLHTQSPPILHSDIKPENIMVTPKGDICLIDFNISLEGDAVEQLKGISPYFCAPEQFFMQQMLMGRMPYQPVVFDARMDLYSTAATFYYLMTGIRPTPEHPVAKLAQYDLPYSQGFCRILDRAMAYQVTDRYPNAHKMLTALLNMEKNDPRYKRYTKLQWAVGILYGCVLTVCIIVIYYGVFLRQKEYFLEAMDGFSQEVLLSHDEQILIQGQSILNEPQYERFLTDEQRRGIFYEMGVSYYEDGSYFLASSFFEQAADGSRNALYLQSYAMALIQDNRPAEAEQILHDGAAYLDTSDVTLIRAQMQAHEGQYQEALDLIQTVKSVSVDTEDLAQACRIEAEVYGALGDWGKQSESLAEAIGFKDSLRLERQYGTALLNAAGASEDTEMSKAYAEKALECYNGILSGSYASTDDRWRACYARFLLEDYEKCRDDLQKILEEETGDYRIYMLLCETYLQQGVRIGEQTTQGRQMQQYYESAKSLYATASDENAMMEYLLTLFGG